MVEKQGRKRKKERGKKEKGVKVVFKTDKDKAQHCTALCSIFQKKSLSLGKI